LVEKQHTTTVHPHNYCSSIWPLHFPPSNLATASDDIPDKKRKSQKNTHTYTQNSKEKGKNTHTHTHTQTIRLDRWEGRKESGSSPSLSLCQSEPAAHQCTMKDG